MNDRSGEGPRGESWIGGPPHLTCHRETTKRRRFCSVDEAIDALSKGRIIIVADAEERENEGDFLAAAELIDASAIHFMTSLGRGQLCVPVAPDISHRLDLAPMVAECDRSAPRFAIPVDHRSCTTGISPLERARTIRAMVDPAACAADFLRPGHIFPLVARAGGLLERVGHTETAVDLARFAGLTPAGVLCEICSEDGLGMALRDELFEIADEYSLPIVTIDAIVEFRRQEMPEERCILEMLTDLRPNLPPSNSTDLAATAHVSQTCEV